MGEADHRGSVLVLSSRSVLLLETYVRAAVLITALITIVFAAAEVAAVQTVSAATVALLIVTAARAADAEEIKYCTVVHVAAVVIRYKIFTHKILQPCL